jgi:hypothetical protein
MKGGNMNENFGLKGYFRIENTTTGETREVPNTIVTLGKAQVAKLFVSGNYASPDPFRWMAIGLGSDTIIVTDTTLGSEAYRKAISLGSTTTSTTTNDTARFIGSFIIDDSKAINEAGLFNQSGLDLGSMLSRTCFATINAGSNDSINTTWDIQVG